MSHRNESLSTCDLKAWHETATIRSKSINVPGAVIMSSRYRRCRTASGVFTHSRSCNLSYGLFMFKQERHNCCFSLHVNFNCNCFVIFSSLDVVNRHWAVILPGRTRPIVCWHQSINQSINVTELYRNLGIQLYNEKFIMGIIFIHYKCVWSVNSWLTVVWSAVPPLLLRTCRWISVLNIALCHHTSAVVYSLNLWRCASAVFVLGTITITIFSQNKMSDKKYLHMRRWDEIIITKMSEEI